MPDFWDMSDDEVDAIGSHPKSSQQAATPTTQQGTRYDILGGYTIYTDIHLPYVCVVIDPKLQKPPQKPSVSPVVSTVTAAPRHLANGNYECVYVLTRWTFLLAQFQMQSYLQGQD